MRVPSPCGAEAAAGGLFLGTGSIRALPCSPRWLDTGGWCWRGRFEPCHCPQALFCPSGAGTGRARGLRGRIRPAGRAPAGEKSSLLPKGWDWSPRCSGPSVQRAVGLLVLTGGLRAGFLIPFRIWFSGDVSGREGTGPRRREMRLDKGEEPASRIPAG